MKTHNEFSLVSGRTIVRCLAGMFDGAAVDGVAAIKSCGGASTKVKSRSTTIWSRRLLTRSCMTSSTKWLIVLMMNRPLRAETETKEKQEITLE